MLAPGENSRLSLPASGIDRVRPTLLRAATLHHLRMAPDANLEI
jgi:hypothetical protein